MSSSTTTMMKKLMMRDFATCFTACTLGQGDEHEEHGTNSSTSTDPQSKAMAYTPTDERRIRRQRKREALTKIKRNQERISSKSLQPRMITKAAGDTGDSSMPSFKEEEYLDFCFREDGAIEMVKEKRNSRSSDHSAHSITSRWPSPNNKIKHGGSKKVSEVDSGNKDKEDIPSANGDITFLCEHMQIDDQQGADIEVGWPPDEIKEVHHVESAESKTVSGESSDSNHSYTSGSSFAFPVLSWEWMGSPVQMPKAEGTRFRRRRHKPRAVPLTCCRF